VKHQSDSVWWIDANSIPRGRLVPECRHRSQRDEAVAQWRFEPGRLAGQPVDVLVTIILDFSIR
jgi:hypothetical protein